MEIRVLIQNRQNKLDNLGNEVILATFKAKILLEDVCGWQHTNFGHDNQTTDGDIKMKVLSVAIKTVPVINEHV